MEFQDRIYGIIKITDPVISDIVRSQSFQRLKGINQYGGVNLIYPNQYQVSRFEHSLGVWQVLQKLEVNLETQVAGLLHDIGHTAFSHMVDLAIGGDSEDFHETHLDLIPGWSDLQKILQSHDIKLQALEHYPEVKVAMPRVGADRLDYAIRDFVGATNENSELGLKVLNNIALKDRVIHFTDLAVAKEFALTGLLAMLEVIYAPRVAVVYEALTRMLREGIKGKWLTPEILYQEDIEVLKIIKDHADNLNPLDLRLFAEPFEVRVSDNQENADYTAVKGKIRYFDPPLFLDNRSILLSEADSDFKKQLEEKLSAFERRRKGECFSITFAN